MNVSAELLAAYRWHRQTEPREWSRPSPYCSARVALDRARRDVAGGTRRYPASPRSARLGAAFAGYGTEKLRWSEKPAAIGLRFVGYASDIAELRYSGWYTDSAGCSDMVRGVVYQLPGRGKAPRFVSGYDDPNNGSADKDGPACIDFATIWEGTAPIWIKPRAERWGTLPGYWSYETDPRQDVECRAAAGHADKLAERMAEKEREYQAASAAGQRFAELGEEVVGERKTALALLAEFRKARVTLAGDGYETLCATIREKVNEIRATIAEARQERGKLAEGDYVSEWLPGWNTRDADCAAAFQESAGISTNS